MKKFIIVNILAIWFLKSNSQTVTVNAQKDTTICFSLSQSKFLLKEHYRANKFAELDSISKLQLQYCDSVFASCKRENSIFQRAEGVNNELMAEMRYGYEQLEKALKQANKATRRQKVYKWIAIAAGSAASGYLGFKYLTKP